MQFHYAQTLIHTYLLINLFCLYMRHNKKQIMSCIDLHSNIQRVKQNNVLMTEEGEEECVDAVKD